jgi:hypothetical protein
MQCWHRGVSWLLLGVIASLAALMFPGEGGPSYAQAAGAPPSALLGEGHIGRYQWSSRIEVPETALERHQGWICLSLFLFEPALGNYNAEGNDAAICGAQVRAVPIIESLTSDRKGKRRTVVAMLFDGKAKRLYLKLRGRAGRTYGLRSSTPLEVGPISAAPPSYFTHGYSGRFCIERLIAYDEAGNPIVDNGSSQSCQG